MHLFESIVIGAGQAGLASAYYLQKRNLSFIVLEASEQTAGSWPHYYDSLTLFSPARYSSLPGMQFPGDPDRYPKRDEVVSYLTEYAKHFQFPIQTGQRVTDVQWDNGVFQIKTAAGEIFHSKTLISATGPFSAPYIPNITGMERFQENILHSSQYKNEAPFHDQRVVIVGGANSAVQIGYELAQVADVTLATRKPISFVPQRVLGKDIQFWLIFFGLDRLSLAKSLAKNTNVLDPGIYKQAILNGKPNRKPLFTSITESGVVWTDGKEEKVDTILFATGFQPNVPYLHSLPHAVDSQGNPIHKKGVSKTVPGLYYVGLSGQRSFASATLRGVGPDAKCIVKRLEHYLENP
jgi:putative flavoprotein involved in K+ transport